MKQMQQQGAKLVDDLLKKAYCPFPKRKPLSELNIKRHFPLGKPFEEITTTVRNRKIDLLVIGRTSPQSNNNRPLGSLAAAICHDSSTHILMVPTGNQTKPE